MLKRKLLKKAGALLLSTALVLQSAVPVFADAASDRSSETEIEIASEEGDYPEDEAGYSSDESGLDDSGSDSGNTDDTASDVSEAEETEEVEIETEEVDIEDSETEILLESEEMTEEQAIAYEAANPDGFYITVETSGSSVTSWKSDSGIYYLFLPNNVSIPDLTFSCQGISYIKSVSNGSYDPETKLISKAFTQSGDSLTITSGGKNTYKVVVMQTSIASVMIDLKGTDLATLNAGSKDIKYSGNTVTLIDTAMGVNTYSDSVEIKGRGNTTWTIGTKKPYQIKFDKKTSVFGMDKAKKWVLLANAFDETMVRNELVFETSRALGSAYTTDYEYANVWVDGEYIGTYMIGEKAEIGTGRVELSHEQGVLVERDDVFYQQEDYWFSTSNGYFTVKETVSDEEASIQAGVAAFQTKYNALYSYLISTAPSQVTLEDLSQYIDLDSWVQYYFLGEFFKNPDTYASSAYFYMDGPDDVIHYGPVWDYDCSMGNSVSESYSSTAGNNTHRYQLMENLLATDAFNAYVRSCYEANRSVFANLSNQAASLAASISSSAGMNYTRWEYAFQSDSSKYSVKKDILPFHGSYESGLSSLVNWLAERYSKFSVNQINFRIYVERGYIKVSYNDGKSYSDLRCAIWSALNGQDDIGWQVLEKQKDGSWTLNYPLSRLKDRGLVHVHLYGDDVLLKYPAIYVKKAGEDATLTISDTTGTEENFQIVYEDQAASGTVTAAVWSLVGAQDDLIWYTMEQNADGSYTATVPISKHKTAGSYAVHIYVDNKFAKDSSFAVSAPSDGSVTAVDNKDGSVTVNIEGISSKSEITSLQVPIWTSNNGQDDIKWYTATKTAEGKYSLTYNISNHNNEQGEYNIHVYASCKNGIRAFVGYTKCSVKATIVSNVTATKINGGYTFKATNIPANASGVRFAVWGLAGGQNDLTWKTATLNKTTRTATFKWYGTLSSEEGTYAVHAYVVSSSGSMSYYGNTSFTRKNEGTGTLTLTKKSSTSFNIRIDKIQTTYKVASVTAAVWSSVNGQDDIKWYTIPYSGSTGNISSTISKHKNSRGIYNVHIYVKDTNGKQTLLTHGTFTM